MTQTEFIAHVRTADGWCAPVVVTRKRVRNLNLRVHADGSVALSIPLRASAATAQDFLNRKADWVRERVERRGAAAETPLIPATGPDAGTIPLWGKLVDAAEALKACEHVPVAADRNLQACIDALYRHELARALPAVAERLETAANVHATRWQIRRMSTRWGSCTPATGAIRINSALAAYPSACLDYVVAHELTHLMEPSHNRRFHSLLDACYPNNREIAKLLKRPAREVAQRQRGAEGRAPGARLA